MGLKIEGSETSYDLKKEIVKKTLPEKQQKVEDISSRLKRLLKDPTSDEIWWCSLLILSGAALITRLSYLDCLPGTTWDEVHFGGFANKYIKRLFYIDVHPPLGKIAVAAAAYVTGYQGDFNFTEGTFYDDTIRYQLIRSEFAVLGALLVPVSFLTVFELSQSVTASSMAALGVLCDTFLHKINSLILLDPLLNITILCSAFCCFRFYNQSHREFSFVWWRWLVLTGVSLGIVISIKYIGVFTVLFVGLHTAYQLFLIVCDRERSIWSIIPHTLARTLCLIILPLLIYVGGFVLHLTILSQSEPNSGGWLHTKFFISLNNTEYNNKTFPQYVNYGSNVTIQSSFSNVGYLESWFGTFPSEITAPCQLVSAMALRDPEGTEWEFKQVDVTKGAVVDHSNPTEPPTLVRNGDWVMLTHLGSGRSLRSHNSRAPVTRKLRQVCGYGDNGAGGPFETWQLIIPGVPEGEPLQVIEHNFILKHYKMNCYLSTSDTPLPETWANPGSKEVTCNRNPNSEGLLWHINWIDSNKVVGEIRVQDHTMSIWERIYRLQMLMIDINSRLKPKGEELYDISTSAPWMWPIAYRMQTLGGYGDKPGGELTHLAIAFYNPLIAYTNLLCLGILLILAVYHYYRSLRNPNEFGPAVERRQNTLRTSLWLVLCWAIHYLPFFFMGRVLYLHHYCPSFIYSCMITGTILNHLSEEISEQITQRWPIIHIRKRHILIFPVVGFITSYVCLYPFATYIEGKFLDRTKANDFLDYFYFGQQWEPIGYQSKVFSALAVRISSMIPIETFENPDVNSTLYYNTDLNTTRPEFFQNLTITPVKSSEFLAWNASVHSVTLDDGVPTHLDNIPGEEGDSGGSVEESYVSNEIENNVVKDSGEERKGGREVGGGEGGGGGGELGGGER